MPATSWILLCPLSKRVVHGFADGLWCFFLFLMFQICSWNVRGLNDLTKRGLVKSVVVGLRGAILCIQETKVNSLSRSFLRSFAGAAFDKCHFIPSNGASGGIATCWNSRNFGCSEVVVHDHSLTLRLNHLGSGLSVYITNVFGPPTWDCKDAFCRKLVALKGLCTAPWVICGDFNLTRNQNERRGRNWSDRLMCLFSNMIDDLEMVDLPLSNQCFTWSNLQHNPTLAKLDRFLISTDWELSFPLSRVKVLPRITSDHSLILLETQGKLPTNCSDLRKFGSNETTSFRLFLCGGTKLKVDSGVCSLLLPSYDTVARESKSGVTPASTVF